MTMQLQTYSADEILQDPTCLLNLSKRWIEVDESQSALPVRRRVWRYAAVIVSLALLGAAVGYYTIQVPLFI